MEVAKRLAPKPFVGGGYTWLGETFAVPPDLIARVDEGRQLLSAVGSWINLARAKYRAGEGQPEITSSEFIEETGIDQPTANAVRVVLGWFSGTTNGSQWNEDGWTINVADEIVDWPLLASAEDLVSEWSRRQQRHEVMAAGADSAKHQLLRATGRLSPAPAAEDGASTWTDQPWARKALWVAGIIGGIAALASIAVLIWSVLN